MIDGVYFDISNEIDNTEFYGRGMDRYFDVWGLTFHRVALVLSLTSLLIICCYELGIGSVANIKLVKSFRTGNLLAHHLAIFLILVHLIGTQAGPTLSKQIRVYLPG